MQCSSIERGLDAAFFGLHRPGLGFLDIVLVWLSSSQPGAAPTPEGPILLECYRKMRFQLTEGAPIMRYELIDSHAAFPVSTKARACYRLLPGSAFQAGRLRECANGEHSPAAPWHGRSRLAAEPGPFAGLLHPSITWP